MSDMEKICEIFRDGDHLVILSPDGSEKRWIISRPEEEFSIFGIEIAFSHECLISEEFNPNPPKSFPQKNWERW